MPTHPALPPSFASSSTSGTRLAFAALLLGNVALAFGPWLVRLCETSGGVGPLASGFWRLALAAPVLLLLTRVARQPIPVMPRRLWVGLAIGGLCFAADLAAWHAGILRTKLANATLFGNMGSFTFAAYGFLVARRLPGVNQAVAMLLAAAGAGLLLGRSFELSRDHLAGDLLCILAGLFYTGYLIAIDRARGTLRPLPALAVSTLAGVLPLLALAWGAGDAIAPRDWTAPILLALGSQVAGQGLLVFAVGTLSPLVVGLGLLTQPIVSAAIGFLAYGERLDWSDALGAAAIAAALVLVRRR